jgi:hypothetical protein
MLATLACNRMIRAFAFRQFFLNFFFLAALPFRQLRQELFERLTRV